MPPTADARAAAPLEAARGAVLAVHAAAGLASSAELREVARIVRAAEGLFRTAVALLARPTPPAPAAAPSAKPAAAPRRRRRPRGRGGSARMAVDGEQAVVPDGVDGGGGAQATGASRAAEVDSPMLEEDDSWADALVRGSPPSSTGGRKGKGKSATLATEVQPGGAAAAAILAAAEGDRVRLPDGQEGTLYCAGLGGPIEAEDGQVLVLFTKGRKAMCRMVDLDGLVLAPGAPPPGPRGGRGAVRGAARAAGSGAAGGGR
ncbi:unnamed protein product [Prorocentrum cordatum]|uniref:Uncharacterized protein n=1 Tax=Prorocentrum cordatum TaxID=2364126 RepID=A0ABN9PMF6_9DINO|nr:unnamed protein product [Polarella glacialis]CAK0851104.1 unnamed protein product [Polarella glacialis]